MTTRAERAERDTEIIRMKKEGLTYEQIRAKGINLSDAGFCHAIKRSNGDSYHRTPDPDYLVYWHWDIYGVLLYIGYTEDMGQRERQHSREDAWYRDVVVTKRFRYGSKAEARREEDRAIRSECPKHNKYQNPGKTC